MPVEIDHNSEDMEINAKRIASEGSGIDPQDFEINAKRVKSEGSVSAIDLTVNAKRSESKRLAVHPMRYIYLYIYILTPWKCQLIPIKQKSAPREVAPMRWPSHKERPRGSQRRQVEYYGDHVALIVTTGYYDSLLALYNIKSNTNSLSTTGTKRPHPGPLWANYSGCVHYDQTYNRLQKNSQEQCRNPINMTNATHQIPTWNKKLQTPSETKAAWTT
eukprot:6479138-Amphidinium_carterae.5